MLTVSASLNILNACRALRVTAGPSHAVAVKKTGLIASDYRHSYRKASIETHHGVSAQACMCAKHMLTTPAPPHTLRAIKGGLGAGVLAM